jgi:hypothetical protein
MPDPALCHVCGRGRPIELQMTVKTGQVLAMLSCPKCESRTWYADGTPVTKDEVLRITANDPEFVVVPSPSTARAGRR